MKKLRIPLLLFFTVMGFVFFYLKTQSGSSLKYYSVDEKGLPLNAAGMTESGEKWSLREYQPQDFEDHWRIIEANKGDSQDSKLYRDVSAESEESVKKRREHSRARFAKGSPWGHMSLLNKDGKCVLVFGLGRRTGREGPVRFGHGDIGLTCDPAKEHEGYRLSMLKFLTRELAPEIRKIGEAHGISEKMQSDFTEDMDPKNEEEPDIEVGPLWWIDETYSPELEEFWRPLLEAGFVFDREGAVDWTEKTQILRSSTFKTLEKDFLDLVEEMKEKLIEYQRYLIMGPKGQEVVVWNSSKWGGIKLCFIFEVPKAK